MRFKIYILSMVITVAFAFSTIAYAQGMGGGNGGGGGMMGGQGGGMGGNGGGGMMGSGQWRSKLWDLFSNRSGNVDQGKDRQRAALRTQIQEKRRELASLVRSENPDRALIDQKIEELDRLEAELDADIAASEGMK